MKQERLDNVQLLRGIAAVAVIFEHAFDQFVNHPIAGMPVLASPIGSVWGNGVDLFFVISGFIMYFLTHDHFAENGYPAEFLKRRCIRVVPTYWLFTTMMILATVARPDAVNNSIGSVWHAVSSYIFIPSARPDGLMHPVLGLGWTLNYEFFFYACYAIALVAPAAWGISLLVAAFLALACLHAVMPPGILAFWSDPIILEFIAGLFIAMAFVHGVRITRASWAVLLAIAGVVLALVLPLRVSEAYRLLGSGLPSVMIAAALILTPNRRWWRPAILIGDASYAMYLTHPFALNAVTAVWSKLHLPLERHAYWPALVLGSLVAGVAVYWLVERPIIALLRQRFEPRRHSLAA